MNKKIIEIINEYMSEVNLHSKDIQFVIEDKKKQQEEQEELGSDIRLCDNVYLENSVTITARCSQNVLAKTTIYFTDYSVYRNVFFWEKDDKNCVLKKRKLGDFQKIIGDICVTFAYTQICWSVREENSISHKYILMKFYINLCKCIINKLDCFCYIEPTGVMYIDEEKRKKNELIIDKDINIDSLGRIAEESIVSDKVAQLLGFYKADNLYHSISGGKIYFSKNINEVV